MWTTEWRSIDARIQALVEAGTFFLSTPDSEQHNGSNLLIENAHDTARAIRTFMDMYWRQLEPEQLNCVALFWQKYLADLIPPNGSCCGFSGVTSVVTYLASFRAEFAYLTRDNRAVARNLVIRAFTHLQRMIVTDRSIRALWKDAFRAGEPACEGLGSCQLLSHGIWAFKTSSEGERTDLVLGGNLDVESEAVQRSSIGLVLTEWKVVRASDELQVKIEQAYEQAKRYRKGILAGFEVASPRYLVMVSEDYLEMPGPREDGEVSHVTLNVAVSPSSPSKIARKLAGRRKASTRNTPEGTGTLDSPAQPGHTVA
jgi:hypothetical protein